MLLHGPAESCLSQPEISAGHGAVAAGSAPETAAGRLCCWSHARVVCATCQPMVCFMKASCQLHGSSLAASWTVHHPYSHTLQQCRDVVQVMHGMQDHPGCLVLTGLWGIITFRLLRSSIAVSSSVHMVVTSTVRHITKN